MLLQWGKFVAVLLSSWREFFRRRWSWEAPHGARWARIAFVDRAIRVGGWPNANTLARELEVSPRTVQRDIGFLCSMAVVLLRIQGVC
jgi:hypothetical protein